MVGLLGASIGSGRAITATGRYKMFPVVGLLLAAAGLGLMSRLAADTSLVVAGLIGFGLGWLLRGRP